MLQEKRKNKKTKTKREKERNKSRPIDSNKPTAVKLFTFTK